MAKKVIPVKGTPNRKPHYRVIEDNVPKTPPIKRQAVQRIAYHNPSYFRDLAETLDIYYDESNEETLRETLDSINLSQLDVELATERISEIFLVSPLKTMENYFNEAPVFRTDEEAYIWKVLAESPGAVHKDGDPIFDFDTEGHEYYGIKMMGSILEKTPLVSLNDGCVDASLIGQSAIENGYTPTEDLIEHMKNTRRKDIESCVNSQWFGGMTTSEIEQVEKEAIIGLAFLTENNIITMYPEL